MQEHYKKYADVAALAGRIMLESHAESYRVEDTVRRIMKLSGLNITEVVSTTTGLYMTLDDSDPKVLPITQVRRISERGNHLRKIYHVNNVSRQLAQGLISIDQAREKLEYIDESEYRAYSKDLALIMMVLSFTYILGGTWLEVLISILAGTIVALSRIAKGLTGMNSFLYGTFATAVTAFVIPLVTHAINPSLSYDVIIIAALMPLYPGTAFMNGIRDTLKGDYGSGIARIADALVIAVSLAIGVAIGLFLAGGILS
ncbi:TPA: threonine/serine exporter ThrE family protein [Streptococcus suis]